MSEGAPKPTPEEMLALREYAGVLAFMHWAMNQPEGKTKGLGELLTTGCAVCGLDYPDRTIESALLVVGFRLAAQDVPFTTVVA